MEFRHLKQMGDLGVVNPVQYSPRDEDSVRRALQGVDVVINLAGKDYETTGFLPWHKHFTFDDVHVKFPEMLTRLALEAGATTMVHVSALAADTSAISEWSQSKARGEEAVRAVAPGVTIVRPADIFGAEDRFLNMFAWMHQTLPRVPLVDGGQALVQPVFVQDVAHAIARIALSDKPEIALGQTYDLAGPDVYSHREVVEFVFDAVRARFPFVVDIPPLVADAIGYTFQGLPTPPITRDRFLRMQTDCVLDTSAATKRLADVGVHATTLEQVGPHCLKAHQEQDHIFTKISRDIYRERMYRQ